jgi:hypothetical protein
MSGVNGLAARRPSGLACGTRLHKAALGCVDAEFDQKQPEALVNHAVEAIKKRAC